MKITNSIIISALLASFVIFSCSKDESPPSIIVSEIINFTVEDLDGNIFIDNEIIDFTTLDYPDASLDFYVRNISDNTIAMRIEVESMTGTDGSLMELCFGQCFAGVSEGISYPTNNAQPVVYINAGETSMLGDHFFNSDPGNGSDAVEYTFKFYQADVDGNLDGAEFRLKYRYLPN